VTKNTTPDILPGQLTLPKIRTGGGRMITPDHAPSKREDWATPPDVFEEIERRWGPFDLDPCATPASAKAPFFYVLPFCYPDIPRTRWDGLLWPWQGRVFMNPPYGREICGWVRKAYDEAHRPGTVVVGLLPARTCTDWFHRWVKTARPSLP
jgi:hypothetical protein